MSKNYEDPMHLYGVKLMQNAYVSNFENFAVQYLCKDATDYHGPLNIFMNTQCTIALYKLTFN